MSKCSKCGLPESEERPLFEMRIELTDEYWMLCDPCIEDFTEWLE